MRLALGTGGKTISYRLKGFVTIDAEAGKGYKPEFIATIPPLPEPVLAMRFDFVEAMHFWEHLYLWEADQLAREIVGIMNPGGKLVLELPNLAKAVAYLAGRENEGNLKLGMWALYGAQNDPKYIGNPYAAHKWGYTPASITTQLIQAGFHEVKIKRATQRLPDVRDMRVEAHV